MAADELIARIAGILAPLGPTSKKMFGGTCFMLDDHMVAGTFRGELLLRVGRDGHGEALKQPHVRPMLMKGREMQGYVSVAREAIVSDRALAGWLERAVTFVRTLPAKKKTKKPGR